MIHFSRSGGPYHRRGGPDPGATVSRRIRFLKLVGIIASLVVVSRLFVVQVLSAGFYRDLAQGTHELYRTLIPERGEIFFRDLRDPARRFPAALNDERYLVAADTRHVQDPTEVARAIVTTLGSPHDEHELRAKMEGKNDPYVPLVKEITHAQKTALEAHGLAGINFFPQSVRFYPEGSTGAHVLGFLGGGQGEERKGQYGIEGYFEETLKGEHGVLKAERDPLGALIPVGKRLHVPATSGADIVLTIDRTIERRACEELEVGMREYKAAGGTVIIMQPKSGALLALCNSPSFNPNAYHTESSISVFNNPAIFTPYEPGSVMKAITLAAALERGVVNPDTIHVDTGKAVIDGHTIENAASKVYGEVTMKEVLINSINTGAIFAAQKVGREHLREFFERFGFGALSGIALDTERPGDISNLNRKGGVYVATASFGQGITTTPLQLIAAFGAIANGGTLVMPNIVQAIVHGDGSSEEVRAREIRSVVSSHTAAVLTGMLVATVEEGHAQKARVPGYRIAGKTGTANIPNPGGGYLEEYNHTFIGYGPIHDPQFVMLVKYERPQRRFADSTTVNTFGRIARFLVDYLELPPE